MPMPPLRKGGRKRSAVGNFSLDEIKSLNCANEIVMDFGVLLAKFELEVGFAWQNQNEWVIDVLGGGQILGLGQREREG